MLLRLTLSELFKDLLPNSQTIPCYYLNHCKIFLSKVLKIPRELDWNNYTAYMHYSNDKENMPQVVNVDLLHW